MRLTRSDPDIETLYRRITDNLLDLQPDFQRGEVWGRLKQQKLVDTILRNWHVPPIHVIKHENSHIQEVLDGKQRLTAIREFMNNEFSVNGNIEPLSEQIQKLHGKRYNELPTDVREDFKRYSITQFLIDNFTNDEPGELFFRLNTPTYLTAAEQRNAFHGEPRQQIKKIVAAMEKTGIEKDDIGFTNSRMAYDDVLTRVCYVFETKTLLKRITSRELSDRYRVSTPFSSDLINQLEMAIEEFSNSQQATESKFRFNKATLFSWFVFLLEANKRLGFKVNSELQTKMLFVLAQLRDSTTKDPTNKSDYLKNNLLNDLFIVFEDRSRARVGNVDSVLIRDIMLWLVFLEVAQRDNINIDMYPEIVTLKKEFANLKSQGASSKVSAARFFYNIIEKEKWGETI